MNRWILVLLTAVLSWGGLSVQAQPKAEAPSNRAEVLSFHGKQRCATCIAIEKLTREVVQQDFAKAIADGRLRLRVVDISKEEALADRYQVTWSSLLVSKWSHGKEKVNDLTEFAFANARRNPELFKARLKAEITKQLR